MGASLFRHRLDKFCMVSRGQADCTCRSARIADGLDSKEMKSERLSSVSLCLRGSLRGRPNEAEGDPFEDR